MAFAAFIAHSFDHLVDATVALHFGVVAGTVTVVAGRRADSKALRFAAGGSYVGTMENATANGGNTLAEGRALYVESFSSGYVTIAEWYYDPPVGPPAGAAGPYTRLCSLRLYADGSLAWYKGSTLLGQSAAGVFTFDAWSSYVEDRAVLTGGVAGTDGQNGIRVNGVDVLGIFTTDNNESGVGHTCTHIRFGSISAGTASPDPVVLVDDYYVIGHDASATDETPYLTDENVPLASTAVDIRIGAFLPSGAGANSGWTPLAGANWENVDDPLSAGADSDTTYVSATNATDTYDWQTFNPEGIGSLFAIQFVCHWMATRLVNANLGGVLLSHYFRYTNDAAVTSSGFQGAGGGAPVWTLSTAYRYWSNAKRRTPSNEAWTVTRMGRMEWGANSATGGANTVRATHHVVDAVWIARRNRQRSRAYLLG